jgi:hypothetical protein
MMSTTASVDDLSRLTGFAVPIYTSAGLEGTSVIHAARFVRANRFFQTVLGSVPAVSLLVLDERDWARYAAFPIFGLTHYDLRQQRVIAPGTAATFLQPSVDLIATHAPAAFRRLREIYSTAGATVDLMSHIDTWLVHDLGHACHLAHDRWFPRRWLMEYAADLCLYTYLATEEPAQLPVLMALPEAVRALPMHLFPAQTWADFDAGYGGAIGLENYLWFHGYLFGAAAQTYQEQGMAGLRALWDMFVFTDITEWPENDALLQALEQAQPALAEVIANWPEEPGRYRT